ncbi:hypothetical protein BKA67DRAFT_542711 [Truncatella angustata]|uniref:FAD-binding PCMH-type domain-containing protein n=1 Tax=Truncatella angustata TaxID=152316 RepID=A0A9P8RJ73_9PEZI|nr:uncharacterized protein BKA67DRAFT_542711 [Truncatella angustata]KAH6638607.1 hypothetical protein BKA67DRAFT_542711 [Truncatella angustata]
MISVLHKGHVATLAPGWISLLFTLCNWSSAACAAAAAATGTRRAAYDNVSSILTTQQWSTGTNFSFPGSPEFFPVTERWTTIHAPSYSGVISPDNEDDLVKILKLASSNNVPFLATGGRHGYTTTYGRLQNGLAIDLSHFNSWELNETARTVTVGPGVTVGEVLDPLYDAGLAIQTGSSPCPSLIGVSLGGGIGRYQGVYGLIADALVSARLITASGDILNVSKDSHPDLFWAIRGAGSNFGIITSATYEVHPLIDDGDVFVGEFLVTAEQSSEFFSVLESMSPLPAELSSIVIIGFDTTTNKVQFAYIGHEEAGRKAMAPILNLNLTVTRLTVDPWNKLLDNTFGGIIEAICQPNLARDLYSLNIKNYSASTYDATFAKMDRFYARHPDARDAVVQIEFFPNQAMAAVPLDSTAFSWRDSTGYVNFIRYGHGANATARDDAIAKAEIALGLEIRDDLAATSGYPELTVFVNYAHGDERQERIYGKEKLPRLAALKKKWDPHQIFSFNNGLPTHYP